MWRILVLVFCCGLVFPKPSPVETRETPQFASHLQDGDIILREGKGLISEMMKNTSATDRHFSHAGLVFIGPNGPQVVHCIGSSVSGDNALRVEPLSSFISPASNRSYAVYRYPLNAAHRKALRESLMVLQSRHIHFDEAFDLQSDSALYCTEFIYKTYCKVIGDSVPLGKTVTSKGTYIGLDDLYFNRPCQLIAHNTYKK